MIDYSKLDVFIADVSYAIHGYSNQNRSFKDLLHLPTDSISSIHTLVKFCSGNFNFWQHGDKINWSLSSADWINVIIGQRDINTLNLPNLRQHFLDSSDLFLKDTPIDIRSASWWNQLTDVYGNDPLRKRETLLYIILSELQYENIYCPNIACIDYNVVTALRYHGIITGFTGNLFSIETETAIRTECLVVCYELLNRLHGITILQLDNLLFTEGRRIRHTYPRTVWEEFFIYRFGCYFY